MNFLIENAMLNEVNGSLWWRPDFDRQQAEAELSGQPSGSFLLRRSSRSQCLSLSHVQEDGTVGHALIHGLPPEHGAAGGTIQWRLEDQAAAHGSCDALLRSLDGLRLPPQKDDALREDEEKDDDQSESRDHRRRRRDKGGGNLVDSSGSEPSKGGGRKKKAKPPKGTDRRSAVPLSSMPPDSLEQANNSSLSRRKKKKSSKPKADGEKESDSKGHKKHRSESKRSKKRGVGEVLPMATIPKFIPVDGSTISAITPSSLSTNSPGTLPLVPPPLAPPPALSPPLSAPSISAPSISAPSISAPSISAPSISAPSISAPPMSSPSISASPISVPSSSKAIPPPFALSSGQSSESQENVADLDSGHNPKGAMAKPENEAPLEAAQTQADFVDEQNQKKASKFIRRGPVSRDEVRLVLNLFPRFKPMRKTLLGVGVSELAPGDEPRPSWMGSVVSSGSSMPPLQVFHGQGPWEQTTHGSGYTRLAAPAQATAREVCQAICRRHGFPRLHRLFQLSICQPSAPPRPLKDLDRPAALAAVWAKRGNPRQRVFVLGFRADLAPELQEVCRRPPCERCNQDHQICRMTVRKDGVEHPMLLCNVCASSLRAQASLSSGNAGLCEQCGRFDAEHAIQRRLPRRGRTELLCTACATAARVDAKKKEALRQTRPHACQQCRARPPNARVTVGVRDGPQGPQKQVVWLCRPCTSNLRDRFREAHPSTTSQPPKPSRPAAKRNPTTDDRNDDDDNDNDDYDDVDDNDNDYDDGDMLDLAVAPDQVSSFRSFLIQQQHQQQESRVGNDHNDNPLPPFPLQSAVANAPLPPPIAAVEDQYAVNDDGATANHGKGGGGDELSNIAPANDDDSDIVLPELGPDEKAARERSRGGELISRVSTAQFSDSELVQQMQQKRRLEQIAREWDAKGQAEPAHNATAGRPPKPPRPQKPPRPTKSPASQQADSPVDKNQTLDVKEEHVCQSDDPDGHADVELDDDRETPLIVKDSGPLRQLSQVSDTPGPGETASQLEEMSSETAPTVAVAVPTRAAAASPPCRREDRSVPDGSCVACGQSLESAQSKFCLHCGTRQPVRRAQPPDQPVATPAPPSCRQCQAQLDPNALAFCMECGTRQTEARKPGVPYNTVATKSGVASVDPPVNSTGAVVSPVNSSVSVVSPVNSSVSVVSPVNSSGAVVSPVNSSVSVVSPVNSSGAVVPSVNSSSRSVVPPVVKSSGSAVPPAVSGSAEALFQLDELLQKFDSAAQPSDVPADGGDKTPPLPKRKAPKPRRKLKEPGDTVSSDAPGRQEIALSSSDLDFLDSVLQQQAPQQSIAPDSEPSQKNANDDFEKAMQQTLTSGGDADDELTLRRELAAQNRALRQTLSQSKKPGDRHFDSAKEAIDAGFCPQCGEEIEDRVRARFCFSCRCEFQKALDAGDESGNMNSSAATPPSDFFAASFDKVSANPIDSAIPGDLLSFGDESFVAFEPISALATPIEVDDVDDEFSSMLNDVEKMANDLNNFL